MMPAGGFRLTVLLLAVGTAGPAMAQRVREPVRPAVVAGRVVHARTQEAMRKTQVTLVAVGQTGRSQPRRSTSTDSDGRFRFADVAPGKYVLQAFRTGFVLGRTGSVDKPIELKSGDERRQLEVLLIPHSVIAGKVVDPEGDPLDQVTVTALRVVDWGGGFRQMQAAGVTRTNDLGEYRLAGLTAGRYYVLATYPRSSGASGGGPGGAFLEVTGEDYVPTYYPTAAGTGQASVVMLRLGEDAPGTVIKMSRLPVYRVAGKLAGLQPGDRGVRLLLMQDDKDAQRAGFYLQQPAVVNMAEKSFAFPSVPPGSYVVLAAQMEGGGGMPVTLARTPVTVSYGDVDDLAVTLAPPVELRGKIRAEGGKELDLAKVRVLLQVVDSPLDGTHELGVDRDGNFELKAASRERHLLLLRNPPAGTYVSAIRVSNEDGFVNGIDLTYAAPLAQLEVVLGTNPGGIEGFIPGGEGRTVTLLPDPPAPHQPFRTYQTVADAEGVFNFRDVAPGSYRLVAMDEITPDLVDEAGLAESLQNRGVRVDVTAGVVERVRLRLEGLVSQ